MTKTLDGAWIVIVLIPILVTIFKLTRSHYESVAGQLSLASVEVDTTPHGHIVIVPIGGVHRAVIEALRYASALAKDVRAVYVNVNPGVAGAVEEGLADLGLAREAGGAAVAVPIDDRAAARLHRSHGKGAPR